MLLLFGGQGGRTQSPRSQSSSTSQECPPRIHSSFLRAITVIKFREVEQIPANNCAYLDRGDSTNLRCEPTSGPVTRHGRSEGGEGCLPRQQSEREYIRGCC